VFSTYYWILGKHSGSICFMLLGAYPKSAIASAGSKFASWVIPAMTLHLSGGCFMVFPMIAAIARQRAVGSLMIGLFPRPRRIRQKRAKSKMEGFEVTCFATNIDYLIEDWNDVYVTERCEWDHLKKIDKKDLILYSYLSYKSPEFFELL
jgi:hypothetical protein